MKLLHCLNCKDLFAMRYSLKQCECGQSTGQYLPDGNNVVIIGPCKVVGIKNRFFSGNVDESVFWYPEDNGKVIRKEQVQPSHLLVLPT